MPRNIEVAHVYADERLSEIHHRSILRMKEIVKDGDTLSIMLDDYNSEKWDIRLEDFVKILELTHSVKISMVVYESSLTKNAEKLLQAIPPEYLSVESFDRSTRKVTFLNYDGLKIALKSEYSETGNTHYKCCLLTAAWQLSRLGLFQFDPVWMDKFDDAPIYSDSVVSIIDSQFRENELKCLKIIESSVYKESVKNIHYEFI
jgi:hypothetical protein